MAVVGFNFTKMNVERKTPVTGKIKINNNVSVKNVEDHTIMFGKTKQEGLKFTFEFTSKYEPNIGDMLIVGEVIYINEPDKIKEIVSEWRKNKKIPKEVMTEMLNAILDRCNIQALTLSRDMSMPPPIPLPKVQVEAKK